MFRMFTSALCCFLLTLQATPAAWQTEIAPSQAATAKQPVLEDGTPVKVRLSQTVSSADAHVDDRVEFEVLEEVKVAGVVVIPKDGIAWGTVTQAQPKRRMARGGKLEIVMDSVRLVDAEKAALRATKEVQGGGHTGGMVAGIVATSILLWPAAPFFLFMHGKDITIPKGTEFPTFINGNLPLDLEKFKQSATVTAPPQAAAAAEQTASQRSGVVSQPGILNVTSLPEATDILVDGAFVGSTPATLKLGEGKHTIHLSCAGYRDWFKEVFVLGGSEVKLNAVLKKNDEEPQ